MRSKTLPVCIIAFLLANASLSQPQSSSSFIKSGVLPETSLRELYKVLASYSNEGKDTLLIRYHYDNGSCWIIKDKSDSDDETWEWIKWNQQQVANAISARPGLSFFEFREPGNRSNRVVRWNNQIIVDSSNILHRLLFKKKNRCSNSILILPDRRFVLFEGDSHNDFLLYYERIENIVNEKLNKMKHDISS